MEYGEIAAKERLTGRAYFQATGDTLGYVDLGNIQMMSLGFGIKRKQHFKARRGIVFVDQDNSFSISPSWEITGDEFSTAMLNLLFLGTPTSDFNQAASTGATFTFTVHKGRSQYVGAFTITSASIAGAVEGYNADFFLDRAAGQLYIPYGSSLAEGSSQTLTYSTANLTYNLVLSPLGNLNRTGNMQLIEEDDISNAPKTIHFFQASLSNDSGGTTKVDDYKSFKLLATIINPASWLVYKRNVGPLWLPGGGGGGFGGDGEAAVSDSGSTPLVSGQSYIDVLFGRIQTDANWIFVECEVVNVVDASPLNIWPGIVTSKATTGFRLQLNGLPDTSNYYLEWAISGVSLPPVPATTYLLSGPNSGGIGVASSNFTVKLPPSTTVSAPVIVTPHSVGGGTFTPTTVTLTTAAPSATFTYTPSSYGAKTISTTNSGTLIDPASVTFTCVATTYTLTGPSSGTVSVPSTNFTVALPTGGVVVGTVVVTPNDSSGGGTFTPTTINLSTGAPSATFTYTPASTGAKTIGVTNSGTLTNPVSLTYTVGAAGLSDGDPVSTWNDSSVNGNNATQSGGARPTFKTNIINAKPVVRFTVAGSQFLNLTTTINGSPFSVFTVMKPAAPTSTLSSISSSAGGQGCPAGPFMANGDGLLYYGGQDIPILSTAGWNTAFHVFSVTDNAGVSHAAYADGASQSLTGLTLTGTTANFNIIGKRLSVYSDGDIAEIIIYNVIVSSTDRANIEKYLGTKYGITVAGGTAVDPSTVAGLQGWWKADSL